MAIRELDLSEATRPLAEYASEAEGDTVILTSRGKAVAALVPIDELDYESLGLSQSKKFLDILARSDRSRRTSLEEVERELGA